MSIITIPTTLREKLGDEATEGLIEMLNRQEEQTKDSVIETAADRFERRLTKVGSDLQLNISDAENHFERRLTEIESGLQQKVSDAENHFERRLTEIESGLQQKVSDAENHFERRLTEEVSRLENKITNVESGLRVEIHKSKSDTIKWMFIFYIGQVAALGGILFAVLR